jgi:hypothetical protein
MRGSQTGENSTKQFSDFAIFTFKIPRHFCRIFVQRRFEKPWQGQ